MSNVTPALIPGTVEGIMNENPMVLTGDALDHVWQDSVVDKVELAPSIGTSTALTKFLRTNNNLT